MDDIYTDILLENYKHPKNWGVPSSYQLTNKLANDLCGDELEVYITLDNNRVKDIHYTGHGCAICLGTMSLLTEKIMDWSVDQIKDLKEEDILKLINMKSDSGRKKCATLSLDVIKAVLK